MHYIEFVSQCFKMLCNAWNCKQTSCIGTKIGQMSGKPSARQKSNLGAQQRSGQPDGDVQHISAWFGHLQFAPNKFQDAHWIIALFLEVRLNPDFSQLSWEDLCIVFCQVLVHLQLQSGQMKQSCRWFFGDWCSPMFCLQDEVGVIETCGNMCEIFTIRYNKKHLSSKLCLDACWFSMSSV